MSLTGLAAASRVAVLRDVRARACTVVKVTSDRYVRPAALLAAAAAALPLLAGCAASDLAAGGQRAASSGAVSPRDAGPGDGGKPAAGAASNGQGVLESVLVLESLARSVAAGRDPGPPAWIAPGLEVSLLRNAQGSLCVQLLGLPAGPVRSSPSGLVEGVCLDGGTVWSFTLPDAEGTSTA